MTPRPDEAPHGPPEAITQQSVTREAMRGRDELRRLIRPNPTMDRQLVSERTRQAADLLHHVTDVSRRRAAREELLLITRQLLTDLRRERGTQQALTPAETHATETETRIATAERADSSAVGAVDNFVRDRVVQDRTARYGLYGLGAALTGIAVYLGLRKRETPPAAVAPAGAPGRPANAPAANPPTTPPAQPRSGLTRLLVGAGVATAAFFGFKALTGNRANAAAPNRPNNPPNNPNNPPPAPETGPAVHEAQPLPGPRLQPFQNRIATLLDANNNPTPAGVVDGVVTAHVRTLFEPSITGPMTLSMITRNGNRLQIDVLQGQAFRGRITLNITGTGTSRTFNSGSLALAVQAPPPIAAPETAPETPVERFNEIFSFIMRPDRQVADVDNEQMVRDAVRRTLGIEPDPANRMRLVAVSDTANNKVIIRASRAGNRLGVVELTLPSPYTRFTQVVSRPENGPVPGVVPPPPPPEAPPEEGPETPVGRFNEISSYILQGDGIAPDARDNVFVRDAVRRTFGVEADPAQPMSLSIARNDARNTVTIRATRGRSNLGVIELTLPPPRTTFTRVTNRTEAGPAPFLPPVSEENAPSKMEERHRAAFVFNRFIQPGPTPALTANAATLAQNIDAACAALGITKTASTILQCSLRDGAVTIDVFDGGSTEASPYRVYKGRIRLGLGTDAFSSWLCVSGRPPTPGPERDSVFLNTAPSGPASVYGKYLTLDGERINGPLNALATEEVLSMVGIPVEMGCVVTSRPFSDTVDALLITDRQGRRLKPWFGLTLGPGTPPKRYAIESFTIGDGDEGIDFDAPPPPVETGPGNMEEGFRAGFVFNRFIQPGTTPALTADAATRVENVRAACAALGFTKSPTTTMQCRLRDGKVTMYVWDETADGDQVFKGRIELGVGAGAFNRWSVLPGVTPMSDRVPTSDRVGPRTEHFVNQAYGNYLTAADGMPIVGDLGATAKANVLAAFGLPPAFPCTVSAATFDAGRRIRIIITDNAGVVLPACVELVLCPGTAPRRNNIYTASFLSGPSM
jgi:hypothetical protein